MNFSKIQSIGSAFPEKVLSNHDLEKIVDTSDEWIKERSGIEQRRILAEGEVNSDFGAKAAIDALQKANVDPKEVDMILYCTNSPDKLLPATACIAQVKIGATNAVAFDINAACAGWIIGVSIADQYIKSGMYKKILVIGGESLSRIVNWKDRNTCVLFGDGAGAALLVPAEPEEESRIFSTHMHSDGKLEKILHIEAGGSMYPPTSEDIESGRNKVQMNGREVFKHAVRSLIDCAQEACEANKVSQSDIDWLIPHQANIRIIETVAKKLNFPMEKVILNVHKYGNTSVATIPTAIDEAVQTKRIKRGDLLLVNSFGGGLTWASMLFRW